MLVFVCCALVWAVAQGAAAAAGRPGYQQPAADDPVNAGVQPATRVVLVGDSIMKGAAPQLEAMFREAGYDVVVDTAESRSTSAGAGVARGHLAAGGADAVVVMLGANDSGNTDTYRGRVREVVASTALVPRLYWMTVPEVRAYYPAANQVVREELALRPGSDVLDWSAISLGGGLTAADGLHLTPAGADAMSWFVAVSVVEDLRSDAEAAAAATTTTITTTTTTTTTTPVPEADQSAPAPSATTPSTTDPAGEGSSTTLPEGSAGVEGDSGGGVREVERAAETSIWGIASGTGLFLAAAMLGVLGILGVSLAVWALWRTR